MLLGLTSLGNSILSPSGDVGAHSITLDQSDASFA